MHSSNFQAPNPENKSMYICASKFVAYNTYHFVVMMKKPLNHKGQELGAAFVT